MGDGSPDLFFEAAVAADEGVCAAVVVQRALGGELELGDDYLRERLAEFDALRPTDSA
jgi:hypothetical protein